MQERIERIVATVAIIAMIGGMAFISFTRTPVVSAQQPPATPSPVNPGPPALGSQQPGFLGVSIEDSSGSVVVRQVEGNGPADQAGIRGGDTIVSVDGQSITSARQLAELVQQRQPGTSISLTYSRNGQQQNTTVTLGSRPAARQSQPGQPHGPFMGPRMGRSGLPFTLPGLEGIPPEQLFDHLRGGTLELTDKNGNPLTITINPGQITGVTTDSITLQLNSGGTKTFRVTADTAGPWGPRHQGNTVPLTQGLTVGGKVVVLAASGSDTALAILGNRGSLEGAVPPAGQAQPGQSSGQSFQIPLPNGSGSFRFYGPGDRLPADVQQFFDQLRKRFHQQAPARPSVPGQTGQPM